MRVRRFAANRLIAEGRKIEPAVVELAGDCVGHYYALHEELPFTEWLGGTIIVEKKADGMLAFKDGIQLHS